MEKKPKKIVFSEKVDNAINGYSVALSFLLISVFIFFRNDYFGDPIVSYIVGVFFGFIGIMGCGIEISKSIKIKGFDNLIVGIIFLAVWGGLYLNIHTIIINFVSFFFLVVGSYATFRGLLEILYSFVSSPLSSFNKDNRTTALKNTFLFLAQIFGFILTLLNILKIIGVIS